jgi:tryptophan-rich sensory protein/tRNA(Arg) A34 adenosine deaminase TadA
MIEQTNSMAAIGAATTEDRGAKPSARHDLLCVFGSVSLVLLVLGGWLTSLGLGDWYYQLEFPPFQPPGWVFTPIWIVVLTMLAVATWRVARAAQGRTWVALSLFGAQCVLNVGWSLIFFTLRRPDVALVELVVLVVALIFMVAAYGRIDRAAGLLLLPCLLWLLFATAINGWIVYANPGFVKGSAMMSSSPEHEVLMREAIQIAEKNPQAPFGTVLVDRRTGQVVARGVNASSTNPTFHGEIAAINDYAQRGGSDWSHLTLYTTAEPCCMCQGAILWSGIPEVVFGVSIADLKDLGWRQIDISAAEVIERSWNPETRVVGGVCRDQCREFFKRAHRD